MISNILSFISLWAGTKDTDWMGVQQAWDLSDDEITMLRENNRMYREVRSF